jgi:hypothetical protein
MSSASVSNPGGEELHSEQVPWRRNINGKRAAVVVPRRIRVGAGEETQGLGKIASGNDLQLGVVGFSLCRCIDDVGNLCRHLPFMIVPWRFREVRRPGWRNSINSHCYLAEALGGNP